ncbi:hypothetical protein HDU98_001522 [Podochytrium sp. JEL0797]|nr:hypothetical protein HDU98_001522 [Podochytrium sp. JEL0797]
MDSDSDDGLFDLSHKASKSKPKPKRKSPSKPAQKKSKFTRPSPPKQTKRSFSLDSSDEDEQHEDPPPVKRGKLNVHDDDDCIILSGDEDGSGELAKDPEVLARLIELDAARHQYAAEKEQLRLAMERAALPPSPVKKAASFLSESSKSQENSQPDIPETPITLTVSIWSQEAPETPTKMKFKVLPSHPFKVVMEAVCARDGAVVQLTQMVFVYKSIELLPLSTPKTMGSSQPGQSLKIDAYRRDYYHLLQNARTRQLERELQRIEEEEKAQSQDFDDGPEDGPAGGGQDEQPAGGGDTLTINLRDKNQETVTLSVRPTTTILRIIQAYLKQTGKVGNVRLEFDHDALDPDSTIEAAGIEDGDLIDVKG